MSFSFHPEAEEEFIQATSYYENCELGPGLDFAREVYSTIQNASDYPFMWMEIEPEIHSALFIVSHMECFIASNQKGYSFLP